MILLSITFNWFFFYSFLHISFFIWIIFRRIFFFQFHLYFHLHILPGAFFLLKCFQLFCLSFFLKSFFWSYFKRQRLWIVRTSLKYLLNDCTLKLSRKYSSVRLCLLSPSFSCFSYSHFSFNLSSILFDIWSVASESKNQTFSPLSLTSSLFHYKVFFGIARTTYCMHRHALFSFPLLIFLKLHLHSSSTLLYSNKNLFHCLAFYIFLLKCFK